MPSIVTFIRQLLRLETRTPPHRQAHRQPESAPLDLRRPLYFGRGMICLGGLPPPPAKKHPRD